MNNFMNKLYVKALVTANMAKNELKKMCEEDEGMDIIVTIVLVRRDADCKIDLHGAGHGAGSAVHSLYPARQKRGLAH